jgi:hypothetical protein
MNTHAKKHAFNYILNSIDGDGYGVNLATDKQKIDFVYNTFKSEYAHNIKYYGGNEVRAFAEYLPGLPSCINIEYRNEEILNLAFEWGSIMSSDWGTWGASPKEAKQAQKILDNWFNYIAINFFQLKNKLTNKENLSNAYNLETV